MFPQSRKPGLGALALLVAAAAIFPGRVQSAAVGPYFNGVFPVEAPGFASNWSTANAFPQLTFVDPIWLTGVPGTNDLVVVGKAGKVWRFPNLPGVTPEQRNLVLDLAPQVQTSEDQGLYRIAFHPQFGNPLSTGAADVFVSYSHRPASPDAGPDKSMWRVSRFIWQAATGTINPASEDVLIQQYDPHRWHNAGALEFDNDGFLLVVCGDGGGANDEFGQTQKINGGFFGGVLRIDVDNDPARSHGIRRQPLDPAGKPASFPASFTQGYGIPNDNPWLNAGGGVLEEFYAIGLRSPHSAEYDSETGELWVGDVGQFSFEEINRVVKGANYQWPFREGTLNGPKAKPSAANLIGVETGPVHSYGRSSGSCVIGGMRYRGGKWAAELGGDLIFGDNGQGILTAARLRPGMAPYFRPLVTGFGPGIYSGLSAVATDPAGEIYMLKLNGQGQEGGTVRKLILTGTQPQPPALLSATGLFTDIAALTPAPGLIPYEVASPLWSDGAAKKRWLVLPNDGSHSSADEQITFSEEGNWGFPGGTIFVKHFEIASDERQPALLRRLETRVMVCTADGGKYGVTYKWNAAGTDATLLTDGEEAGYPYTRVDGSTEMRPWSYPSRADCFQCHTPATGQALGLRTHQINCLVTNPANGQPISQLSLFNIPRYFSPNLSVPTTELPRAHALDDGDVPLEHRVRSYLDSNCAHCHQPGSSAPFFDARLSTPLRGQNLIGGLIAGQFDLGPEGRYIRPGDAVLSAVHVRMASAVPGIAMPPLGKHTVDARAAELIGNYIRGLDPDEFAGAATPVARYLRISSLSGIRAAIAELSVLDGRGMPLPGIVVLSASSQDPANPAARALDGDPATYWSTPSGSAPHWLTVDLGLARQVGGFIYLPRQDNGQGRITSYQVELSTDGTAWFSAASGTWSNTTVAAFRYDEWNKPRPVRCQIGGPPEPVRGAFEVTVVFDSKVQDFAIGDLNVQGGTASSFRGQGYYYTATVTPQNSSVESTVTVSVAEDAVNPGGLGSRPASFTVHSHDIVAPYVNSQEVEDPIYGPFNFAIGFNEPVAGLDAGDFRITNGVLESFTGEGRSYVLRIVPDRMADVIVGLAPGTCSDLNGNPSIGNYSQSVASYSWYFFSANAFERSLDRGFDFFQGDPPFVAAPEGWRAGNQVLDENWQIAYNLRVTEAGAYRVRALTRADDPLSCSFYLGVNDLEPVLWNVNRGPGQIGSGQWYSEYAAGTGEPYVYQLAPGEQRVRVYARDDGTKLAKIELVPLRPFPMWGNLVPVTTSSYPILLPLDFTDEVSGLTVDDFVVQGGRVLSVQGAGRSYQVAIAAEGRDLSIMLPADRCTGPEGHGNSPSFAWRFVYHGPYEDWALASGLDDSAAGALADPDRDGVAQLLEYAFGMNPLAADRGAGGDIGLPQAVTEEQGGGFALRFVRRRNVPGLRYTAEFAGPGFAWSDSTAPALVDEIDAMWERVTIPDVGATGATRRFGRVKVGLDGEN